MNFKTIILGVIVVIILVVLYYWFFSDQDLNTLVSMKDATISEKVDANKIPNAALLNIGSEEVKGNEIIKETFQILNEKNLKNFKFSGYIEGNELMNGNVNVIVSDGFTGNVALKTAEGTANFITNELKKAISGSILGKISSL